MKHRTIINIFTGLALAAAVAVIALISIILTGKSHLYNAADRIVQGNNCAVVFCIFFSAVFLFVFLFLVCVRIVFFLCR